MIRKRDGGGGFQRTEVVSVTVTGSALGLLSNPESQSLVFWWVVGVGINLIKIRSGRRGFKSFYLF